MQDDILSERSRKSMEELIEEYGLAAVIMVVGAAALAAFGKVIMMIAGV